MEMKQYLQPIVKLKSIEINDCLMVSGYVDEEHLEDGGYGDGSDAAAKHYNIWEQEL